MDDGGNLGKTGSPKSRKAMPYQRASSQSASLQVIYGRVNLAHLLPSNNVPLGCGYIGEEKKVIERSGRYVIGERGLSAVHSACDGDDLVAAAAAPPAGGRWGPRATAFVAHFELQP